MNINGSHVSVQKIYSKHKLLLDCIIQKWPNSVRVIEKHLMAGSRDVCLQAFNDIKYKWKKYYFLLNLSKIGVLEYGKKIVNI